MPQYVQTVNGYLADYILIILLIGTYGCLQHYSSRSLSLSLRK